MTTIRLGVASVPMWFRPTEERTATPVDLMARLASDHFHPGSTTTEELILPAPYRCLPGRPGWWRPSLYRPLSDANATLQEETS